MEIGKEDEDRLLKQRKLVLLVDLDQTLIHTTNDNIPPNLKDVKHFQLWHGKSFMWYHTRFRPFTLPFIEAVSKMYELHICTFGVRLYAHTIARLLDPDEKYFSHRILSRDECFDAMSKTANLKALFPCGDKMVCIIDDREDVWKFAPNLVHVKPYRFFQGTADINAPPGLTKKEHDGETLTHKVVDPTESKDGQGKSSPSMTMEKSEVLDETSEGGGNIEKDASTVLSGDSKSGTEDNAKNGEDNFPKEIKSLSNCGDADVKHIEADDGDQKERQEHKSGTDNKRSSNTPADDNTAQCVHSCEESSKTALSMGMQSNIEDQKDRENGDEKNSKDEPTNAEGSNTEESKEVEWDDTDDYLLHLEEILTRIHTAFYDMYEQSQKKGTSELPDLKSLVPYVRKKVLKGANIVFSGMIPLNMPLEKSKAYVVATALGASVHTDIVVSKTKSGRDPNSTTHLVAAKAGTGKHKNALKVKGLHIVNGDWLWACSERWEWVDESLFPLSNQDVSSKIETNVDEKEFSAKKKTNKRKLVKREESEANDKDCEIQEASEDSSIKRQKLKTSEEETNSALISGTYTGASVNPLCSFTDEELVSMDKEVDLFLEGEDDNTSDETDDERDKRNRKNVLGSGDDSDSDSDSLSGDFPRGWKLRRKSSQSPVAKEKKQDRSDAEEEEESQNELDVEHYEKNINAFSREVSSSSDSGESIGSVNEEIAEALEKEFLGAL
ncbi:RNA polymerase II subunit A C-terminal domain phosphatase [Elysia marginata]|uniref:RNA polymerase II subunit A C-terminal domain phosphatase n=1 Tax=Elysia marginata TaxID=1093978 RepID=A0AAV4HGL6_9GAST|nr:RNA polymerase II subunit A C-terminal domain phosphatase [Elysia marginata]